MIVYLLKLRKILLCNYFYFILVIIVCILSLVRLSLPRKSVFSIKEKYFYGTVIKYYLKDDKLTIYLKDKETIIGNYYLDKSEILDISLGDKLFLQGSLEEPMVSRVENTFNYKKYLSRKNIFYFLKIDKIKKVSKNKNIYYFIKNYLYNRVKDNPYLSTFILGDKTFLSDEIKTIYQDIGISHLFAISGMHISILSGILLKFFKNKERSYLIVSFLLVIYLLFIDTSPSAIRGVLFFVLFSLNKVFYFYVTPLKIFILTLVIVLLINPFYVYDIGFLYSFFISFALIFLSNYLSSKNYFLSLLKVSFLSFLVSIPISLYNFYQLNFLSIVYNLFFVPYVSLFLFPLEIVTFILPGISKYTNIFTVILEKSAFYLSKISFGKFIFAKVNFIVYIVYFLIIILFLLQIRKGLKKNVFLLLIIVMLWHYFYTDKQVFLEMLDIGQGDCLLIYDKKEAILVDTGGIINKELMLAKNRIIPHLKSLGIKRLEKLILTHGDYDHLGEATYLLEHFKVKEVILNSNKVNYYEQKLLKYNYKFSKEDMLVDFKDIILIQLNGDLEDENPSSQVYLGIYKDKSFLLMGDAPSKTEGEILKNYDLSNIDILKVGHHGSNTSSSLEFLEKIKPKISLISAGIDNKFNHPHEEVVKRLSKYSDVYVTKDLGSIRVDLDSLKVTWYSGYY